MKDSSEVINVTYVVKNHTPPFGAFGHPAKGDTVVLTYDMHDGNGFFTMPGIRGMFQMSFKDVELVTMPDVV